ncbi:signal-transducing adaptor protein 2 isoform X2 [Elgaria multicarinata webbii]|uniref:signal-transducing adaptor protein 2 isoform X2 n=1 Tax=Elgaria multicarinata webbii TaxID=159646 RepID=UPI002FCD2282
MAVPRSSAGKLKPTLPPHYFEGFLEKKSPRDKDYKKYWAGLRGLTLYFYNTSRDVQYVEKIDLADFVSLADEDTPSVVATWPLDGARLNLKMRSQEVKLKMESLDSREMWKGFILTMVEMKIPLTLSLLPGHVYMLSEALEKEKQRRCKMNQPDPKAEKDLPDCFFRVSRTEAEVLLEKNENCGNMLLRPGGDGKSVSVTTRQKVNGTVATKHYKIYVVGGEYVIDVEEPYRCCSLADVVEFFVTNSKRVLVPLALDESYAMTLEIMETDKESGESTSIPTQMSAESRWPPKATAPRGEKPFVSPRGQKPPARLPPIFPVKPPVPGSATATPERVYEEEDVLEQTYVNDEDVAEMRQTRPSRGMTEELKRKLQERRATLED